MDNVVDNWPLPLSVRVRNFAIGFLVVVVLLIGVPFLIGYSIGLGLGMPLTLGFSLSFISCSYFYIARGLRKNDKTEFALIERLGKPHDIKHDGLYLLVPIVDRIVPDPLYGVTRNTGNIKRTKLDLFQDEKGNTVEGNKIDFNDGISAAIKVQVWRQTGSGLEPKDHTQLVALNECIYKLVYAVHEPIIKMEEIIDATIRPYLERMNYDEAKGKTGKIIAHMNEFKDDKGNNPYLQEAETITCVFEEMGQIVDPETGVLLTDILLSKEDELERRKKFQGKQEAEREIARVGGTMSAIKGLAEFLAEHAGTPTKEEKDRAMELFLQNKTIEMFGTTGANVSLILPGVEAVKTLSVDPQRNQPKPKGGDQS